MPWKNLTAFLCVFSSVMGSIFLMILEYTNLQVENYYIPHLSTITDLNFDSKILVFYDEAKSTTVTVKNENNFAFDETYIRNLMSKYAIYGMVFAVHCVDGKFESNVPSLFHFFSFPFCFSLENESCWKRRYTSSDDQENEDFENELSEIFSLFSFYFSKANYIKQNGRPLLIVKKHSSSLSKESQIACKFLCNKKNDGFSIIYSDFSTQRFANHKFDNVPVIFEKSESLQCTHCLSNATFYQPFHHKTLEKAKLTITSEPFVFENSLREALNSNMEEYEDGTSFVLISSWKSLQPSNVYGFANLEALRMAQLRNHLAKLSNVIDAPSIAIFVHAYYVDVMPEIIVYLKILSQKSEHSIKIYVAVLPKNKNAIATLFKIALLDVNILPFENRGRDILPFLSTLPRILSKHNIIAKINTKKSVKYAGSVGEFWRKHSYNCLLKEHNFKKAIFDLQSNSSLGILYPAGLVLPLKYYPSESPEIFSKISQRMGLDPVDAIKKLLFGAGTMFIARANALLLLANVAFPKSAFEEESTVTGTITLAHAIERAIAVSVHQAGFQIKEMDEPTCSREDFYYFSGITEKIEAAH